MAARGGVAMSDLVWLSEAQMRRIEPYFPLSNGVLRIPMKPATDSSQSPATYSDFIPAGIPI
jgi:hypothetical protein